MDSASESDDEGPSESMAIKSPQKLMKVEIIGRKRKIVSDETPKRAAPPLKKKPKEAVGGSSSNPKLDKKLEKLKPYLEKYEALPEVIESLNNNKKNISKDFIDTIIQSSDGGECIAAYKSFEGLSPVQKGKNRNYIDMLIRVRYGMGLAKNGNKKSKEYSNIPECNLGESCFNLHHYSFEKDNPRPDPRDIGGYTFKFYAVAREGTKCMWDYWCCKDCQYLKDKVQYKHRLKVNGEEVEDLSYGYLRMNPVSGQLEDPGQIDRKIDPENPGRLPHVCGKKPELDRDLKIEATIASISTAKNRIKKNEKEIEESVEALIRELDAEKSSETLKNFMNKYNNAFKYDKKHRKYFLYFITVAGSKEILYFGITCNPKRRLYEHKIGTLFNAECDGGVVLQMHLMPLGNINLLLAADIETLLIRLSKDGKLSCKAKLRNPSNGRFSSKRKFARSIIEKKGAGFDDIITSLNELIAKTFDHGVTIASNDVNVNLYSSTSHTKKRLSSYQKALKTLTDTAQKKLEAITPESINMKKFPDELLAHVLELQNTFKKSDDEQQYFLYFFTYANERQAIYYGISATPYDRHDGHETNPKSPLFELFKGPKKLDMYLVPLGATNLMMAAEVETCFIRLSKAGFINDGNVVLNPSDGVFSSTFEAREEYLIAESGDKFEKLVLVMNQIYAATLAAKRLVT